MLYQIYGLVIDSDDLLPRMPFAANTEADVQVRYASLLKPCLSSYDWFLKWHLPSGKLWLSFAKVDGGYLLRFNKLIDFFVRDCGKEILCISKNETPTETIRHLLLNQVIPLVINLRGGEALHASAVLTSQGLIAFIGPTGSGKSTLAGSFLNAGDSLLSDDCLPLVENNQGIYAIPAYPGLRLWGDALDYLFGGNGGHKSVAHYTGKCRVENEKITGTYDTKPQLLKRLYTIADSAEAKEKADIVIEPLSPREGFMALVRCAFRLDITDRNMLTRQFQFLNKIVSTISVHRLTFPKDFKLLSTVRDGILTDLKDLDN